MDALRVLSLSLLGEARSEQRLEFLGRQFSLIRRGCRGDMERLRGLLRRAAPGCAAVAMEDVPLTLQLGEHVRPYAPGGDLVSLAGGTPLMDGHLIRAAADHWGVRLLQRLHPGLFAQKRLLLCPGLNHAALGTALARHVATLHYADPGVYFGLPAWPGVGSPASLEPAAMASLDALCELSPRQLLEPRAATRRRFLSRWFAAADLIAGDPGLILHCAPEDLGGKTLVLRHAPPQMLEAFWRRGVTCVVTLLPSLRNPAAPAAEPAPVLEALIAAAAGAEGVGAEDNYLNRLAELDWRPALLQPPDAGPRVNHFAFVVHPLEIGHIHNQPGFRWTRWLPDRLVELLAAYLPPFQISTIRGGQSPVTGQRIEGYLYTLGATPRQMMRHGERFTYRRLRRAAVAAERKGARIMGLGAFTSVVGDAGITVSRECDIAITSGNSLTVAATLEAAKQALRAMGALEPERCRAMVVGATGSIGAVCARLLARTVRNVVLVAINPERLIELQRLIRQETPGARVTIATSSAALLPDCDLVVTATSAFGQRVVDLSHCRPGAVVCDVARPHDVRPEEAALRPDVLVIDSGEVLIPGDIDFGVDIGLPPKVAYACLAETSLLAMEGMFVDFTVGREIELERVEQIYRLFRKHGYRLAELRAFDQPVTEEMIAAKRRMAGRLRDDPRLLARTVATAEARMARIPVASKGVGATHLQWPEGLATVLRGLLERRLQKLS